MKKYILTIFMLFLLCIFSGAYASDGKKIIKLDELNNKVSNSLIENKVNSSVQTETQGGTMEDKLLSEKIYLIKRGKNSIEDFSKNMKDEQLEVEFDRLVQNIRKEKKVGYKFRNNNLSMSDELEGYINGHLNQKEKELFQENRIKGLLCLANGKMAVNSAERNYQGSVLHNGNGDAYRHIYWNYRMGIDVGYNFAKRWSDAHEYGSFGQPELERRMDIRNNMLGLILSQRFPGNGITAPFKEKTQWVVRGGVARIIENGRLIKSNSYGER